MDVTLEDQQQINKFSRLNTQLHEIDAKLKAFKAAAEDLEEAENELMLADEEHVPYFVGECFFHIEKDQAEERLQKAAEEDAAQAETLQKEKANIQATMTDLKTVLYGKFGTSINLED